MRRGTYLNVILTVNAVLLTGLLWTQLADRPLLETEAAAQSRTKTPAPPAPPNAAEQRAKMIKTLNGLKQSVDAQRKLMESGKLKVTVTNLDEIELEAPSR
ncbi:MAG: hypothetical protein SYC29_07025 [Planctomycetota bacterium]|nr:hypothetical protein [Planctomycetota bacterium]